MEDILVPAYFSTRGVRGKKIIALFFVNYIRR